MTIAFCAMRIGSLNPNSVISKMSINVDSMGGCYENMTGFLHKRSRIVLTFIICIVVNICCAVFRVCLAYRVFDELQRKI